MEIDCDIKSLHGAACDAEKAWEAELGRVFGKDACNARYDRRGISTAKLRALAASKQVTYDAYQSALHNSRR